MRTGVFYLMIKHRQWCLTPRFYGFIIQRHGYVISCKHDEVEWDNSMSMYFNCLINKGILPSLYNVLSHASLLEQRLSCFEPEALKMLFYLSVQQCIFFCKIFTDHYLYDSKTVPLSLMQVVQVYYIMPIDMPILSHEKGLSKISCKSHKQFLEDNVTSFNQQHNCNIICTSTTRKLFSKAINSILSGSKLEMCTTDTNVGHQCAHYWLFKRTDGQTHKQTDGQEHNAKCPLSFHGWGIKMFYNKSNRRTQALCLYF